MSVWFMWALLVMDLGAAIAFLHEGKPATAGIWAAATVYQLGWVFVAKGYS